MKPRVLLLAGALLLGAWQAIRMIRTSRYCLRDKVAVITGGSRGLGLVLARHVCAQGGSVALIARDPDELARAKADLAPRGGAVLTIECDLLDARQIQSAVQQIIDRFDSIDILINNAGAIEVGPLENMTREDFERAMRLHFWAPFELIAQIVPEMRVWGGGRIVNISSIGGKVAVPHLAPYSVSKFALTGFSDAIRAELARDNIHVTTVAPGMMRTGSHVNAKFKGKHDMEFAWFAASAGAPMISMNADRAARKIIAACRRGQPSLTLTFAARGTILGNALFPNLTGYVMRLVNRFLPKPSGAEGNQLRDGFEVRRLIPVWLTRSADRATIRNNEERSN
ncbi:MAG TPA: SDR family oxidoreductase [Candidatus Udaeobacter sp.]|jgi:NAD(P)-dependent dehydrogenase (short-subunit alcohol dehydrogenase family)|nr:SDR family oxidoreductase [Candidatus Udaeobacter sp.]